MHRPHSLYSSYWVISFSWQNCHDGHTSAGAFSMSWFYFFWICTFRRTAGFLISGEISILFSTTHSAHIRTKSVQGKVYLQSYIQVFNPFYVNFLYMMPDISYFHLVTRYFKYHLLNSLFFSISALCIPCEYQVTEYVWVCVWALYLVPLVSLFLVHWFWRSSCQYHIALITMHCNIF